MNIEFIHTHSRLTDREFEERLRGGSEKLNILCAFINIYSMGIFKKPKHLAHEEEALTNALFPLYIKILFV